MSKKRQELADRAMGLYIWGMEMHQDWLSGKVDDDEFEFAMMWLDKQHDELKDEMTVMELTENICLN